MADYTDIQKEETMKAKVFQDYFEALKYGYEPNIDNIDFVISEPVAPGQRLLSQRLHFLWAEAKRGIVEIAIMLTQLILTCKKTYEKGEHNPPPYIGCFDAVKIAFVPFRDILPIFKENDFNWNITPSNHESPDFIKARAKVLPLIAKNLIVFRFDRDCREIQDFIKTSLYRDAPSVKIYITADNFVHVYNRWVKEVKPTINISKDEWLAFKKNGVLDCDFYRADLMSKEGTTITEKLKIVLENDQYKFQEVMQGRLFQSTIDFTDGGKAYHQFWNKYQRPPLEEYQAHIIDRRDLLVPQNIREVKGSFFTPPQWVKKSQEYLEKVFGKDWQDEYYLWDCAAGTGNLLAGLTNEYNIWASTIDNPDVDSMKALINDAGDTDGRIFNLLEDHIFQFDFLNDQFDKLPRGLRDIINDPEKRKKLIIYINPPYAEGSSYGFGGKPQVSNTTAIFEKYKTYVGAESLSELFAQFFIRIFAQLTGAKIASFAKIKYITDSKFAKFRQYFTPVYKKGFICEADTFDNVKGKFPIGFLIWDTSSKSVIDEIKVAVVQSQNSNTQGAEKTLFPVDNKHTIAAWRKTFYSSAGELLAYMVIVGPSFRDNNITFITLKPSQAVIDKSMTADVTEKNVVEMSIYLTVRHAIPQTWLNDRDQYLYPKDGWKNDTDFQNDCLISAIFHSHNSVSSKDGVNHWVPFTEKEVGARDTFQSNFMSMFLKGRELSPEAAAVMEAGKALWKYYHKTIKTNKTASVDASFYDIREFFQGRTEGGKMNNKSTDETYNALVKALRDALKTLAAQIAPKVYEYGFLKA